MHTRFLVIGAGLSGLAAAIRLARFNDGVLLLEKHSRVGGLNSYYYRNNCLFETGLHAITNYAPKSDKKAPLNRLLRQLKIRREEIGVHQQIKSEVHFTSGHSLVFSNNFDELRGEIDTKYRSVSNGFSRLVEYIDQYDPFVPAQYLSARQVLKSFVDDPHLIDMILCPLLYYGSSWEDDIDFSQFVIMFRSIFQEGMFRPRGTIKDLLDLLLEKLALYGATIKLRSPVKRISVNKNAVCSVTLDGGEEITCDFLVSTIGSEETNLLLGNNLDQRCFNRLSFTENIFQLPISLRDRFPSDRTCIFFNADNRFSFRKPPESVDLKSGVICLPFNFQDLDNEKEFIEIRTTHLANFDIWHKVSSAPNDYARLKKENALKSAAIAEQIIGSFYDQVTFQDTFTPITVQRYTGKIDGAIYGSPAKIKDGVTPFTNLFIAGTDQGFLGIVGSMLSGVSIVNQQILTRL